ncbi:MAG: hypothetical protein EAZ90_24190 [Oscillatoriales cyanobacterium]|nr:MAG: hypothetical protein EAZ94_17315 [Oscillatoriales cyanobacterium]TAE22578.1 MAG: hypothetical protein EAZ93_17705 [Oscillatoriales cyanobacterium]TAE38808.1 MAG: hypothetical protein EAZ90_24190 [Oscillatoriales cyanobacterium]TAE53570.1 MAG: hypothetical protein EAZ88_11565 [Oscillatoriales cyanobacterium]TAE86565.1 MAG: hypothetical protein EAZ83_00275 [Oscillatoriales cyanobacterium]
MYYKDYTLDKFATDLGLLYLFALSIIATLLVYFMAVVNSKIIHIGGLCFLREAGFLTQIPIGK